MQGVQNPIGVALPDDGVAHHSLDAIGAPVERDGGRAAVIADRTSNGGGGSGSRDTGIALADGPSSRLPNLPYGSEEWLIHQLKQGGTHANLDPNVVAVAIANGNKNWLFEGPPGVAKTTMLRLIKEKSIALRGPKHVIAASLRGLVALLTGGSTLASAFDLVNAKRRMPRGSGIDDKHGLMPQAKGVMSSMARERIGNAGLLILDEGQEIHGDTVGKVCTCSNFCTILSNIR